MDEPIIAVENSSSVLFKKLFLGFLIILVVVIATLSWIYISKSHVKTSPTINKTISPYQKEIDHINSLSILVKNLPPLRTGITEDQIPQVKREIQNAVTAAIEALQKGDKKEAAQQVAIINPNLVALGGKTVFIPTETINKIDKDHLYMQAIARGPADPTLMQAYLTNAQMIVGFLKN